ncbi:MAG: tetraacyldisaccharide 4'-kinase, partial [Acidobacteria bacterium]|nr:tetraacyldisaccharide 4'-kinase [Acidobacteriota bacterium]
MADDFATLVDVNFLAPFGLLYGRIVDARNHLYDSGKLRSYSLGARTISIGNLTTGGTGKTPIVALVTEILAKNGEKVCILTRGYGRKNTKERVLVSNWESVLADAATGGDEPVELARRLLGKAIVVADADRVAAAQWVRKNFAITVFVLDDGFQHRRAARDLDIVCIDATNPWGNGRILPAGNLRESLKELRRADAVVITRSNLVGSVDDLVEQIKKWNREAPIFLVGMQIRAFTALKDHSAETRVENTVGKKAVHRSFAFCGLGNPDNFRRQLESEGVELAGFRSFGDHHRYIQPDIDLI